MEGVRTFTTEGAQAAKFDNKALPKGEYELKLLSDHMEIRTARGKAPRVSVSWEVLNTGKDGRKNRWVFTSFYTSTVPGQDGVSMPYRGGQIVDLANALGEKFTGGLQDYDTDTGTITGIDARDLLNWLKSKAGTIVRGNVKVKPAKDGYPESNDIASFIPPEETQVSGLGSSTHVGNGVTASV